MEESQLLERLRRGEQAAQSACYLLYRQRLYATACHVLGAGDPEAEDVVHDSFMAAWRSIAGFEGRSGLYTWLNHICVNECFRRFRDRKRQVLSLGTELEAALAPRAEALVGRDEEAGLRSARLALLKAWIAQIGGACAELLKLRLDEGLQLAQIKDRLKLPMGTAASRLRRCLQKLKDKAQTSSE